MPTNKRITDLTDFASILPYVSEMFGVYQPMIGWRSQRVVRRYSVRLQEAQRSLLQTFATNYVGISDSVVSKTDCVAEVKSIDIGRLATTRLIQNNDSVLMQAISDTLPKDTPPVNEAWKAFVNTDILRKLLGTTVAQRMTSDYKDQCRQLHSQNNLIMQPAHARQFSRSFATCVTSTIRRCHAVHHSMKYRC
jgi:hypothetical protein